METIEDWKSASDAWVSEDGSAGVIFVHFAEGRRTVVLKGSSKVAEEVFASLLSNEIGIRTVKMRIVEYTSKEWTEIKV